MENKYLTYKEYTELNGNLPENLFKTLEYKAELKVDEHTFNRFRALEEYPEELKMCVLNLIDTLNVSNDNVKSESLGNHSKTYNDTKETEDKIISTLKMYLSNIKVDNVFVLYRGF